MLRAPIEGQIIGYAQIGDHLEAETLIAEIQAPNREKSQITSPFKGVLRGLIHPGLHVAAGLKIGDVDPRDDREACFLVSDKAIAIGGGVLEAILSRSELRTGLWD